MKRHIKRKSKFIPYINEYIVREAIEDKEYSPEEEKKLLENIKNFNKLGEQVYRSTDLKALTENVYDIVEFASKRAISETDDWFDERTANRHIKNLQEAYKIFETTALGLAKNQQMFEAVYEEMGQILDRYFTIESLDDLETDDLEFDDDVVDDIEDTQNTIPTSTMNGDGEPSLSKQNLSKFTENMIRNKKVINLVSKKLIKK